MIDLHVTDKDSDVRGDLLLVWQHCVAGRLKNKEVIVHVHRSASKLVKAQCRTFGRMDPPFSLHFIYDQPNTAKRSRTNRK